MTNYHDYNMCDKVIVAGYLKIKDMEDHDKVQAIVDEIFDNDIVIESNPCLNNNIAIGGKAYYANECFLELQTKIAPYLKEASIEFELPSQIPGERSKLWRHTLLDGEWYYQEGKVTFTGSMSKLKTNENEKEINPEEYDEI